jgi:hypothetical protein
MNAFAHLNVFYNSVFMMSSPETGDSCFLTAVLILALDYGG